MIITWAIAWTIKCDASLMISNEFPHYTTAQSC